MVATPVLETGSEKRVGVQVPLPAPEFYNNLWYNISVNERENKVVVDLFSRGPRLWALSFFEKGQSVNG